LFFAQALRTTAQVGDFGLVDLVAHVVGRRQARGSADGAIDVDDSAALATYQVVVVIINATFVASSGPDGLNPPDETLVDQDAEGVVDGLA
jgi:hypothetical protein